VSLIAAVDSAVAAAAGVAIGFGLFFVLRVPLAAIPFTGQPFFPAELSLGRPDIAAVAVGVPAAAAVAARAAFRAVSGLVLALFISPWPPRCSHAEHPGALRADGAAASNILADQFSNISYANSVPGLAVDPRRRRPQRC